LECSIDPVSGLQEAVITVDPFVQRMLSISLGFTMLSVALGLRPSDFSFVQKNPKIILIGSTAQLLLLPLMTLALIFLVEPAPGIALGMLIIASCPGGNISNFLTRIGGGDAAYSVSLTMVSSLFVGALLPFAIIFWTNLYPPTANLLDEIEMDRVDFIVTTAIVLFVPLATGLGLVHFLPAFAEKLNKVFMPIAVGLLVLLVTIGIYTNIELIEEYLIDLYPLIIGYNLLAFLLGFIVGKLFLTGKRARALTFEVGIQNTGLGLIIVLAQFGGVGSAALVVGGWSIWHMFAGFIIANLFRLQDKTGAQAKAT
jgi:BASS family bile acid:Na+ symporter